MRTLLNPWFITACLFWAAVQVGRLYGHPLPYVNSYLTDVAAVPVMGNLSLWFMRVAIIRHHTFVLSPGQVFFIWIYLTVGFEIVLPHFSGRYTADWADALMYATGAVFFYKVMNRPLHTGTKMRQ